MIASLNDDLPPSLRYNDRHVAFVDGDSKGIHFTIKNIHEQRKRNKAIYVVTLLSKDTECSSMVKHLSDSIVDKKTPYVELKNLVKVICAAEPKMLEDNIFGNILGGSMKASQKEHRVLQLLVEGYSQSSIAKKMNLSIKTVSAYKVKAVKRHGARNFNELYMFKFCAAFPNVKQDNG